MSIAAIVTRGYFPGMRVASIVKRGYSSRRQLPEPPPSGYRQLRMVAQAATSPFRDYIAAGDILQYKATTLEGYPVTIGTDGEVVISSAGDNSRQRIPWNFWDASADELYFTGDSTVAANDVAPVITVPSLLPLYAQPNVPFDSVNLKLEADAFDFEGDEITVTAVAGADAATSLPPGAVIDSDGFLSGIITADGLYIYTLRYADEYGAFAETTQAAVVGNFPVPSVVGLDLTQAQQVLQSAYFFNLFLPGTSTGTVASQLPLAGTVVDPRLAVVLSLQVVDEEEEEPPPPPFVPPAAALKNRRPVSLREFFQV